MFFYCFIDKNADISLYVVFCSKWMIKETQKEQVTQKKRHRIPLYATRARPNLYVFRIFYFQRFISIVYSCYVFYISVAQKLGVDLRPRDLEGFKEF